MKTLVTGHSGFVGRHFMARYSAIPLADSRGRIDLHDTERLRCFISTAKPKWVVHLAAASSVVESLKDERAVYETNVLGTLGLLDALKVTGFKGRFLYISSSEVYGALPDSRLPASEQLCPQPRNPYAASKTMAETLCQQWMYQAGFEIIIARPFNHTGPGQSDRFSVAGFARQVAEIQLGLRDRKVVVGDLSAVRDFLDVRDVVTAYQMLLEKGRAGEIYNVASGEGRSLGTILNLIVEEARVNIEIEVEPARLRAADVARMVGDPAKVKAHADWRPCYAIRKTVSDMLEYWRTLLRQYEQGNNGNHD